MKRISEHRKAIKRQNVLANIKRMFAGRRGQICLRYVVVEKILTVHLLNTALREDVGA
jgi:hypothetical protein